MARARSIKPGFFSNDSLVELPFEIRLLFIGLWTIADKRGRLLDRPKKIRMEVFPADNIDCDQGLDQLAKAGFLVRYEVAGQRCIQIMNWDKHQNPHIKEAESSIPAIPVAEPEKPGLAPENPEVAALTPSSLTLDSGFLTADTTRAALPAEFEEFLESTYPQTSHGRNTIAALKRAQGLIGSGKTTESELRRRLTNFRQFVDTGGYSDPSKVPSMQSWFEPHREDPYWARDWAPIPSKAQRAQDSNIAASQAWLRSSTNA